MTQLRCEIKAYKDPQEASYIAVRVTFFRVGVGEGIFLAALQSAAPRVRQTSTTCGSHPCPLLHIPLCLTLAATRNTTQNEKAVFYCSDCSRLYR
jgi:hypothetical protein